MGDLLAADQVRPAGRAGPGIDQEQAPAVEAPQLQGVLRPKAQGGGQLGGFILGQGQFMDPGQGLSDAQP